MNIDCDVTVTLIKDGNILDINILDHIVVGRDEAYSIIARSQFEFQKDVMHMNIKDRIKDDQNKMDVKRVSQ